VKAQRLTIIAVLVLAIMIAIGVSFPSDNEVLGQSPTPTPSTAYGSSFVSAVTYQNISTQATNVQFQVYNQAGSLLTTASYPLNPGAGSSLHMGNLGNSLPSGFAGSIVMLSNRRLVGVLVQIPQNSAAKNRPMSNIPGAGMAQVRLPTVLKNTFNSTSVFAIQNTASFNIDLVVKIYNASPPSTTPTTTLMRCNVAAGSASFVNMGTVPGLPASFNGSAIVEGYKSDGSCPGSHGPLVAPIVGTVLELATNGTGAKSYEGIGVGALKLFMPTALCDAFGNQRTAYAVQNVSSVAANVTVRYSSGQNDSEQISPGAKASFLGCDVNGANFSGAATIESDQEIVTIGKVYKSNDAAFQTAFLGERQGASKLALPYVRWTNDYTFSSGRQRTFIAIQNVGAAPISNVKVFYRNKNGELVGTHTFLSAISPNQKVNSRPIDATPAPGHTVAELQEFGMPSANPGGGYGGAAVVEGPGDLVAIARVTSFETATREVAEDYNAIPFE
jgi:hypothetical protein